MSRLRSVRAFVAVLAMIFVVVSPFLTMTQVIGQMERGPAAASMSGMMDCGMCAKADMALSGCAQASCQMAAVEADFVHVPVTEPLHYRPVTVTRPAEWHSVPPVSPG